MRNKVFILTLSVVMVLCSSFSVFAASYVVTMRYAEPATSPTQGYLVVRTDTDSHYTFFWSINPKTGDGAADSPCTSSMNLIIEPDSISFIPITTGGVSASYHITQASELGSLTVRASGSFDSAGSMYTWKANIVSICYYGNVGVVDNNLGDTVNKWLRVNWGDDNTLNSIASDLSSVLDKLNDIYSRLGSINIKLDELDNIVLNLDTLNGTVSNVLIQLRVVNSHLDDIIAILDVHTIILNDIRDLLGDINSATGSSDTEPMDDSNIDNLGKLEEDFTADNSAQLDGLSFEFGSSFTVVWDLISNCWQANSKVFTIVIMCLTVGVLKLIFNR